MIEYKHASRIAAILFVVILTVSAAGAATLEAATPGLSANQLSGPLGGALAFAFASGCIAGYGFCVRTVLRISNNRITNLEQEMRDLRRDSADALQKEKDSCARQLESFATRQRELEDMLLGRRPVGMFSQPVFVHSPEIDEAIEKLRKEP